MKQRNQFAHLSEQDRNLIIDLCSQNTYERAAEILMKSRDEGGLNILTSPSTLCRFYTSWHPEPGREVLAQYATATYARHQVHSNALLGAIRASAECRILESLKRGKALQDLEKEIRLLKTVQNVFLQDAQWRRQNPRQTKDVYKQFVERSALAPEPDFVDLSQDSDADRAPDFAESSDISLDIAAAQVRIQREIAAEDRAILARNAARAAQNLNNNPALPDSENEEIP